MKMVSKNSHDFLQLATEKLLPEVPTLQSTEKNNLNGDHSLQIGQQPPWQREGKPKAAAVLIPILERDEPTVLLTVRSPHLRKHSGQISFPGGRVDPEDSSLLDAALREAHEEIGLPRDNVSLLGYLDHYLSGTNYLVTPVVAKVQPDFDIILNPDEVSETFEVPLSILLDPARHELHSREIGGVKRYFYAIPYEGYYIWGVTAGIIHNMYERLFRS